MNSKVFFLFLFSISLIYSFSIGMTALPTNITFGNTYNTTFSITALGPITTDFYLTLTGVNASNEINVSMDEANCSFNSSVWACLGYNKPSAGSYQTKMHVHFNEYLDPSASYSWKMDYGAIESIATATTQTTTSYSSSGGSSFAPRPSYKPNPPVPPKNITPITPPPPTAQNTTTNISVVPPNQTIEPTAQNETNQTANLPIVVIQPIELIEPQQEEKTEDYLLPAVAIGLLVVGMIAFGVYSMTRQEN